MSVKKYVLFPLNGKEPAVKGWQELENDVIINGYNLGLKPINGLLVIDVDIKNGAKGLESLQKLSNNIGIDLESYKNVITQSGGYHIYLNSNLDLNELRRYNRQYPNIEFIHSPNGYAVYKHPDYKILKSVDDVIKENHTKIISSIIDHLKQFQQIEELERDIKKSKSNNKYDLETLSDILSFCDPDSNYSDWFAISGAFKTAIENNPNIDKNEAFKTWVEWCQSAETYNDDEHKLKRQWDALEANYYSLGTLLYYAKESGYDVRGLFYKNLEDSLGLSLLDMNIYDLLPVKLRVLNDDNKYEWIDNPLLDDLDTLKKALLEIKERIFYDGSELIVLSKDLKRVIKKRVTLANIPKLLNSELNRAGRFKHLFKNGTPLVKLEMLASYIQEITPITSVIQKDSWSYKKELKNTILFIFNERKYSISKQELENNKAIFDKFLKHWEGNYEKILKLHMLTNKLGLKKGNDIAIIAPSDFGKSKSFEFLQKIGFNGKIPLSDLVKNGTDINNVELSEYLTNQIILDEKNYYHRSLFDITDSVIYRGMYKSGMRITIPNKVFLMADSGAFGNTYQDSQIINRVIILNYGSVEKSISDVLSLHPYSEDIIIYHLSKMVRDFETHINGLNRLELLELLESFRTELKEFNKGDEVTSVNVVNFEEGVKEVLKEFANNPYPTQMELRIPTDKLIVTGDGVYLRNPAKYIKEIIESINAELAEELKFKNLRDLIHKIGLNSNKTHRLNVNGDSKVLRALYIPKDF